MNSNQNKMQVKLKLQICSVNQRNIINGNEINRERKASKIVAGEHKA